MSTHEAMRSFEEQLTALENSHGADSPPRAARPQPAPEPVPPHAPLPQGTQNLLDAQLGEALKMMRDFSAWVHHPHSDIAQCLHVGHTLGSLMTASATLAAAVARLQKGEPESRHRMIVEYAAPQAPEGEGSAKSRKRINRGDA